MAGRGKSTATDMVRSLAVVGIAVAFLVFYSLQEKPQFSVPNVDVDATVQAARKNLDFPVLALGTVPPKWRSNGAFLDPIRGEGERWNFHVGYVTPDNHYFGIDESNQVDIGAFVSGFLYGVDTGEKRTVAGLEFKRYTNEKQQIWLHRGITSTPYAIVITGVGSAEEFEVFAKQLSAG